MIRILITTYFVIQDYKFNTRNIILTLIETALPNGGINLIFFIIAFHATIYPDLQDRLGCYRMQLPIHSPNDSHFAASKTTIYNGIEFSRGDRVFNEIRKFSPEETGHCFTVKPQSKVYGTILGGTNRPPTTRYSRATAIQTTTYDHIVWVKWDPGVYREHILFGLLGEEKLNLMGFVSDAGASTITKVSN